MFVKEVILSVLEKCSYTTTHIHKFLYFFHLTFSHDLSSRNLQVIIWTRLAGEKLEASIHYLF